jgi:DNA polymerase I-like protein with 3'-5' exonuclease and polymerase domains
MTYEYKLLNYLIQGSAADCTKEAILRYHRDDRRNGRFLVTVYDEINVSSQAEKTAKLRRLAAEHELKVLKEAMESIECDVLMLTDAKLGENWADAKKYED